MRSTIVLSALTVLSLTLATEASANSNGQSSVNGQWSSVIPGPAIDRQFSEPAEDMADPDGYEEPGPCHFFEVMVNTTVGTFDWRRDALAVCQDYYGYQKEGRKIPDTLEAAYGMLEIYKQAWKDRQVERDAKYIAWQALPVETPEWEAARKEVEALNFTDAAKKQMAEETGLLMVLEAVVNGY